MSKTVEPNSTTPLAYSKEVFDQLCLLCGMNEMTKGPGRTIQIRDEGVFTEMVNETLDWTFSCDLTEPGSPDPLTAPAQTALTQINPIGEMGVQLVFSDGHDRGIYPWPYLHELTEDLSA